MLRSFAWAAFGLALWPAGGFAKDVEQVRGNVKSFHESPRGDVDGLELSDGTAVRFPPHVGEKVAKAIEKGDEVSVEGERHVGPRGDEHLRARLIKNVASGEEVRCDAPPPDRKPRPRADRGPPPHEQILAEVRAIRALLDDGDSLPQKEATVADDAPPHERVIAELRILRTDLARKLNRR